MTPLRIRLAAAAIGAGLVLTVPAAALADPSPPTKTERSAADPEQFRTKCLEAIDKRLAALGRASSKLAAAKHVTDGHEATLASILADATASLNALAEQIRSDSEPETMKAHCRSVFVEHRVFALVLPRTRLVVAADTALAAADRLDEVAARIEEAIAKADTAGEDVTRAKIDLEAMRAEIGSARSSASPIAEDILALTPADWNEDHQVLTPAREALQSARTDLREAKDHARRIVAGLRG